MSARTAWRLTQEAIRTIGRLSWREDNGVTNESRCSSATGKEYHEIKKVTLLQVLCNLVRPKREGESR